MKLTESMLRKIIKEEIKKGSLLDKYSMPLEKFLRLNAGKVVTIQQIRDATLLDAQEIIDAIINIQIENGDEEIIHMDLGSVKIEIDPDFS